MTLLTSVTTTHRVEGSPKDPANQRVVLVAQFTLTDRSGRETKHALGAMADRMTPSGERSMDDAYNAALAKLLEQVAFEIEAACE